MKVNDFEVQDIAALWTICSRNGIVLDEQQIRLLERYIQDLLYWNAKVNLISRNDVPYLLTRHILHSLSILKYVNLPQKAKVLDVGTGGGLPGIPLKIARQDIFLLLIDSIGKKARIVKMFAQHIGLPKMEVQRLRAEQLADFPQWHAFFDAVLARAVAPLVQLLSWVETIVKPGGQLIALKGGNLEREKQEALKKFPYLEVEEIPIIIEGVPWFQENQKKIIRCTFPQNGSQ